MQKKELLILLTVLTVSSQGQSLSTVRWQASSAQTGNGEVLIKLTAHISPGWHLYSQHIGEGGPLPTKVIIDKSDDYFLKGTPEEKGSPVTFYDSAYEMPITWYTGTATFQQRIKLHKSTASISGKVEFMTCNTMVCVPGQYYFNVPMSKKVDLFKRFLWYR